MIEASFPLEGDTSVVRGCTYETGLLGLLLIPSHLHSPQSPQTAFLGNQSYVGEFFLEETLLKHTVEAEQRIIWQVS